MRKLIVSMNITADGFMAAPDHGLDWHFHFWNEEMADELGRQLDLADTLLLGRNTYQALAEYWPLQMNNPFYPRADMAYAEMINRCRKIVFSRTLKELHWKNAKLATLPLIDEVRNLKRLQGKNMLIYGSGSIVKSLMRTGLIDEFQLWVHPVRLLRGDRFPFLYEHMEAFARKEFLSGVVLECYGEPVLF